MQRNFLINNVINIIMVLLIGISIYFLKPPLFIIILLIVLWLGWAGYSNYMFLFRSKDIIAEMKQCDKKHLFSKQIMVFADALKSIELKKELFSQYDDMGNISLTYELIAKQVNNNANSALHFIKNYDYYSNASQSYLNNLTNETRDLIRKLNDLSDMLIQIENDVHDVDLSYVNDMLESLRRIGKNEQQ